MTAHIAAVLILISLGLILYGIYLLVGLGVALICTGFLGMTIAGIIVERV